MPLAAWQATIVDEAGNIQDSASVEVLIEATGATAALFSDRDGLNPIINPATADDDGFVRFYAAGGSYRINATLGAFTRSWRHVALGILSERDVVTETLVRYERTAAELAAGVTPTNYNYQEGYVHRYKSGSLVADGTVDWKAAIQAAINVGKSVFFLPGTYLADNITTATNGQVFYGFGDVTIKKQANGALWTCNGRDTFYFNLKWNGNSASYTGDNFVVAHDNCSLFGCGSRDAAGRAVKSTTGNGLRIIGTNDIYQTADATATGYDIEITGGGNYSRLVSVVSNQSTGGVLIDNAGAVAVSECQIGKLTTQNNGGVFAVSNRFGGAVAIRSSNNAISNNAFAANVTLGNGATGYSGIAFADTNIMQSGTTFTLESGVIDSVVHVGQLQDGGVTVVLNDTGDNFVTSRAIAYAPTWTASVSNPAIGNGSFVYANYTRKGRRVSVDVSLLMGSTTTFGTGIWRIGLPFAAVTNKGATGPAWAFDATNVPYVMIAEAASTLQYVTFYADQVGGQIGASIPFTWAQDDRLRFSIEYDVG